jgi:hypothetical protein
MQRQERKKGLSLRSGALAFKRASFSLALGAARGSSETAIFGAIRITPSDAEGQKGRTIAPIVSRDRVTANSAITRRVRARVSTGFRVLSEHFVDPVSLTRVSVALERLRTVWHAIPRYRVSIRALIQPALIIFLGF